MHLSSYLPVISSRWAHSNSCLLSVGDKALVLTPFTLWATEHQAIFFLLNTTWHPLIHFCPAPSAKCLVTTLLTAWDKWFQIHLTNDFIQCLPSVPGFFLLAQCHWDPCMPSQHSKSCLLGCRSLTRGVCTTSSFSIVLWRDTEADPCPGSWEQSSVHLGVGSLACWFNFLCIRTCSGLLDGAMAGPPVFSTVAELLHSYGRPTRASFSTSLSAFPFDLFENPFNPFYSKAILSFCSFEICWYKFMSLHLISRDKLQEDGDPVPGDYRFHLSKLSQWRYYSLHFENGETEARGHYVTS